MLFRKRHLTECQCKMETYWLINDKFKLDEQL
jgi:hypothetical protein